ncbi:hypothetical protein UPYG_G00154040 [Umbra pygmaea]|uniref:Uncharacterized protein n=1 Tax=Umbra pygmaea TaxID=75934 RepID=A0ABD0WYY3_UMBPY
MSWKSPNQFAHASPPFLPPTSQRQTLLLAYRTVGDPVCALPTPAVPLQPRRSQSRRGRGECVKRTVTPGERRWGGGGNEWERIQEVGYRSRSGGTRRDNTGDTSVQLCTLKPLGSTGEE